MSLWSARYLGSRDVFFSDLFMFKLILIISNLLWVLGWTFGVLAKVPNPEEWTLFDVEHVFESDGSRGPYRFSDQSIQEGSTLVWVAGRQNIRGLDFKVDFNKGLILFFQDIPRGTPILVRFRTLPQMLQPIYWNRPLPEIGEVSVTQKSFSKGIRSEWQRDFVDSPQLEVGGTKQIQVTFGSDRGSALTQSLKVHILGEVAEGVKMQAFLSDRNLPLGVGGSTRSLQELDKVFFKVSSQSVAAGLGDLDISFNETSFGRYQRQLKGASFSWSMPRGKVKLFGAAVRGQWRTQRILPSEGYQGPYILGESGGQVVPGSERIYLDGVLLKRGEGLDYVITYEWGRVTFTPANPIIAESRITAEYQTLEDGIQRRLMGLRGNVILAEERLLLGTTVIREADHHNSLPPFDFSGRTVSSSHHQVTVLDGEYSPLDGIRLSGEVALSDLSRTENSTNSQSHAVQFGVEFFPSPLVVGGHSMGKGRMTGSFRQVAAGFSGFDRIDRVEMEGRWGWRPEADRGKEQSGQLSFQYSPKEGLLLNLGYGRRTGVLPGSRREVEVKFSDYDAMQGDYCFVETTHNGGRLSMHRGIIKILFRDLRPGFHFLSETASGGAVRESSIFYAMRPDVLKIPQGVKRWALEWDISSGREGVWTWSSALNLRKTRLLEGTWRDSLRAWSHRHQAELIGWRGLEISGEYTRNIVRSAMLELDVRHTDLARGRVRYVLPRGGFSQQISYRISSMGRTGFNPIYVEVGPGRGDYSWEDVDKDGLQDSAEFFPDVNGDYERLNQNPGQFQAVRSAALGARIKLEFNRLFRGRTGKWSEFLSKVAIDFTLQADRQVDPEFGGCAPWNLYLFKKGLEVISGRREIRAKIHLFRYSKRASFRVFGRKRDRLNWLLPESGIEKMFEVGATGRIQVGERIDLESKILNSRRNRSENGPFAYFVQSNSFSIRGQWRLLRSWQMRLRFGAGRDHEAIRNLEIDYLSLAPEMLFKILGRGRVRASLDFVQIPTTKEFPLFLGLAQGNRAGKNLVWRSSIDYRIARYLTALISYDGRKQAGRKVIHLGRMEMKAVF